MNDVVWFCSNCGTHLGLYDFKTHSVTEMFTIIDGNLVCSGCIKIVKDIKKSEDKRLTPSDGNHGVRGT